MGESNKSGQICMGKVVANILGLLSPPNQKFLDECYYTVKSPF